MSKAVILLSGGLDSAVTVYYAKKKGYRLTALIFDYNQRHKKEIAAAKKISRINKINYFVEKINIPWAKSSLTNKKIQLAFNRNLGQKGVPSSYVAGRNIIFLSYAFSLAESIKAKTIFIGAHVQDYSGYPDCRPEFLKSYQSMAAKGLKTKAIRISAPLLNLDKKAIVALGLKLKVPFKYTWSCYKGGKLPCAKCDSCRFRQRAFKALGLIDPAAA